MFRSRSRNVFTPTAYGSRRRRRIPRWLILLVSGVVIGSGGLLFLQKSYGPTRLTVEQSEQLQFELNSANIENQRLTAELEQQKRELESTRNNLDETNKKLTAAQERLGSIDNEIQILANAIPADPRGTSPGIRAATFRNHEGNLQYKVLVMQDKKEDEDTVDTFKGTAEIIVTGRYSNGAVAHHNLPPFDMSVGHYTQLEGELPLPNHFTAREATIRLKREGEDKVSATRTLIVR